MEISLPFSVDPSQKEEPGLSASASSSSRLSNLSSSSRRLRHVSPPPSSRSASQRKGLGFGHQSQLTPQKPTSETFHSNTLSASSAVTTDETHHNSPLTAEAAVRTYKVIRGVFFLWKWFCIGYFCVTILDKLRHLIVDWRNSQPYEFKAHLNNPDFILSTLPLDHRLSKLSSLYPIPLSLEPFLLGPLRQENTITACIWTNEPGLLLIPKWASSWSGPISLLVTHSSPPHSLAYKELRSRLVSLSQAVPSVSFHIHHSSTSLHNFNAYVNIARLFSSGSRVLLFPPSALTLWGSLPQSSVALINTTSTVHDQVIIPVLPLGLSNASSVDMSRNTILPSSALLLHRDNAPWCTERLFTIGNVTEDDGSHLALITEMSLHWQECVWNIWLRSHGKIQLLHDVGWADSGGPSPLPFDTLPETVESNLRVRLARRQRSETCFLVAREMIALGEWFTVSPPQPKETGENTGDRSNSPDKQLQMESAQAKWLRSICRETLERWGKELILE